MFQTSPQRHGDRGCRSCRDTAGESWADRAAAEVVLSFDLLCSQWVSVVISACSPAWSCVCLFCANPSYCSRILKSKCMPPAIHVFWASNDKRFGVVVVGSWEEAGGFVLVCFFWDSVRQWVDPNYMDGFKRRTTDICSGVDQVKILQNTSSINIQLLRNLGHCFIHLAEKLTHVGHLNK